MAEAEGAILVDVRDSDELYEMAVAAGCKPFWHDGIRGPAWHCGCDDLRHACDQQSSQISWESLGKAEARG